MTAFHLYHTKFFWGYKNTDLSIKLFFWMACPFYSLPHHPLEMMRQQKQQSYVTIYLFLLLSQDLSGILFSHEGVGSVFLYSILVLVPVSICSSSSLPSMLVFSILIILLWKPSNFPIDSFFGTI